MNKDLNQRCCELIEALDIGSAKDVTGITPLTGGVSSDIACVALGQRKLCVKFALPKLKVAADWYAPIHRNRAEYEWLTFSARVVPMNAVKLYGRSEELHGFAMEYIDADTAYLWKTALLTEQENRAEAQQVGELMGQIHAASTSPGFNSSPFHNRDDFYAIRIEPYLIYTASQHPPVAKQLTDLAENLFKANRVLVHGDISPKNILVRDNAPIILDAECATMGDACFDLAFCLNHLVLKAIHLRASHKQHLHSALQLWRSYQPHITWEDSGDLETRIGELLPALMLARVDGKSPVEYLNDADQRLVRTIAINQIESPYNSLQELISAIASRL